MEDIKKQAEEILEIHFGSDFWKVKEADYFENIINAMLEHKHGDIICSKSLDVCMYIGPANKCLEPINECVHQVYRNTQKITNKTPKKQYRIKLPGNKVVVGVVCPTQEDFKKWCSEVGEKSYRNAKFIHIYKVKHVNYRRFYAIEGGYNFENVDPIVFQEACYRIQF